MNDRVCCGIEIDPKYVDVTIKRWQKLSGKQAVLEVDWRSFEEVSKERLQEETVPCPDPH